jgi:sugar fermentation stimulation protein A
MSELLKPNAELALNCNEQSSAQRKTLYDVVAVRTGKCWVSIDSRVPNKLVVEALEGNRLREFQPISRIKAEIPFGSSRFDFLLETPTYPCLLEVKSCTLVNDGLAIFPDAPTVRGSKHMRDLTFAKRAGYRACVMFVIQREDATLFRPNKQTDPEFCSALRKAWESGVEIYARRCRLTNFDLTLDAKVPVKL